MAEDTPDVPEYAGSTLVHQADVVLLLDCVRARFMAGDGNAIVLAIEGLKWLAGDDSVVTRVSLEEENASWHSQGGTDAPNATEEYC